MEPQPVSFYPAIGRVSSPSAPSTQKTFIETEVTVASLLQNTHPSLSSHTAKNLPESPGTHKIKSKLRLCGVLKFPHDLIPAG